MNKSYKYIAASEGYAERPMHDSVYMLSFLSPFLQRARARFSMLKKFYSDQEEALLCNFINLVISPLLSLMKHQVRPINNSFDLDCCVI